MRALARYAVANAVVRAMLSELLTRQDFQALIGAASVRDAWEVLRRATQDPGLPQEVPPDPLSIEKQLREATALRFKKSIRMLTGRPQEVGALLLSRWELDNLEFALRLWHGKDPNLTALLAFPLLVHDLPILEIVGAQSIEDIALMLRRTPYQTPISASVESYKQKRSIFHVEVALERDYYRRLLKAVNDLGGADAQKGAKIVGAEIDMLNLSWLARLLHYYGVPSAELAEMMIPGPSALSRQLARPGLSSDALDELGAQYLGVRTERETRSLPNLERVALLEQLVGELAVASARDMLAGFPFSITCVFAFYLLNRVELKNLCAVFAGKASGLSETEISKRLVGLG